MSVNDTMLIPKPSTLLLAFLIAAFYAPLSANAASSDRELLPQPALGAFEQVGDGDQLQFERAKIEGAPFAEAMRIHTLKKPAQVWNLKLKTRIPETIAKGDVVVISFKARMIETTDETGEAFFEVGFEPRPGSYMNGFFFRGSAGSDWREFILPFEAKQDFAKGLAVFDFRVGVKPQVIEIGGISVKDYGAEAKVSDFRSAQFTYPGREPDAPWRKLANERIEKYRKGDFTIKVLGADGKQVTGAAVELKMVRHAYGFGSAVDEARISGTASGTKDNERYREEIRRLFNKITFENALKWQEWEKGSMPDSLGAANRQERTRAAAEWLRQNHLAIRGHTLIWQVNKFVLDEARQQQPQDMAGYVRKRIEGHIEEIIGAFKGKVADWDVLNEPGYYTSYLDLLGKEAVVHWFDKAHEVDPEARLFLNEFFILSKGGKDRTQQDKYAALIEYLKKNGAPIGGIGIQGHMGLDMTPPERIWDILDRFAAFGLPIQITEFDCDIEDEQLQADYTRDFMTAVFSHPSSDAIMMWGFWDGAHWRKNAPLFRKDWSLKKSGEAWLDLVTKQWHTDLTGKTDSDGIFRGRAFFGDYTATAEKDGLRKMVESHVSKEGGEITIKLAASIK